jgi:hypothetical protein
MVLTIFYQKTGSPVNHNPLGCAGACSSAPANLPSLICFLFVPTNLAGNNNTNLSGRWHYAAGFRHETAEKSTGSDDPGDKPGVQFCREQ